LTSNGSEPDFRALVDELKKLRQGPAIVDGVGKDRLPTVLRPAFGVRDVDDDAAVRAKLFGRMRTAAEALSPEERVAMVAAFGLAANYRGRFYKDRVEALAAERNVNPRTVRRWIDRGLEPLARALLTVSPANHRPDRENNWWTDRLVLSLALDEPATAALEVRTIVAARDALTEIDLAMTITDADPELVLEQVSFRILYGGTLRVGPMESSDRVGLGLTLPGALQQGETHEFAILTQLPAGYSVRPHFVSVPRYPCAQLDMRVRFPATESPQWICKLVDVYQRDIDDDAVAGEEVTVNGTGEVRVAFTDLMPARATGLRWRW
jgi:hypothetical protein